MCVETRHGASLHCVPDKGSGTKLRSKREFFELTAENAENTEKKTRKLLV